MINIYYYFSQHFFATFKVYDFLHVIYFFYLIESILSINIALFPNECIIIGALRLFECSYDKPNTTPPISGIIGIVLLCGIWDSVNINVLVVIAVKNPYFLAKEYIKPRKKALQQMDL